MPKLNQNGDGAVIMIKVEEASQASFIHTHVHKYIHTHTHLAFPTTPNPINSNIINQSARRGAPPL